MHGILPLKRDKILQIMKQIISNLDKAKSIVNTLLSPSYLTNLGYTSAIQGLKHSLSRLRNVLIYNLENACFTVENVPNICTNKK